MTVLAVANDATATSYTNDSSFRDGLLNVTNEYRVHHNASKLEWNTTLADYAQDLAEGCEFEHSVSFTSQISRSLLAPHSARAVDRQTRYLATEAGVCMDCGKIRGS
jgi:hypothetical protein